MELLEKVESFELKDEKAKVNYMSDVKNWVCVHATKYEPKVNLNGERYIETTGMATDYKLPRASVHVTLNQVVTSHMAGNWDNTPFVVLVPYNELVSKNVNPQSVSVNDTWFIPNPDTGLVLPDNAFIVKPAQNGDKLYEIGKNSAVYKTSNYTEDEVKQILEVADYYTKSNYENAKSDEEKNSILFHILRDNVVKLSLGEMGKKFVSSHEDDVSVKVASIANDMGLKGDGGNKSHSESLESRLENRGLSFIEFNENLMDENIDNVYKTLTSGGVSFSMRKSIMNSIVDGSKLNFDMYSTFANIAEIYSESSIKDYNPFLDMTIRNHSNKMNENLKFILNGLKKKPWYSELQTRLKEYLNRDNMFVKGTESLKSKGTKKLEDICRISEYNSK